MREDTLCKVCGRRKSEHHPFDEIQLPDGCVCGHDDSWGTPHIPSVCETYIPECTDGTGNCQTCEHDGDCHA